jgi:nucleoside-diphosphate-sugar epimerase
VAARCASYPDRQPRPKLDGERARREFDFAAEIGLQEGLRQTLDWYEATHSHALR